MRAAGRMWRRPTWDGHLVVPLLVWLAAIAALAGGLAWEQGASERELRNRFELRASIGANFAANHAADQVARARRQAEHFLTGATVSEQRLAEVSAPFGYTAVVLLDDRGRLLQGVPANPELIGSDLTPRYDHLRTAVRDGVPAVSRVVPSAAMGVPLVAFATPFDTPYGRRVFSGGLPVQNSPLGSYLGHAIALPSSRAYLIDPDDKVVASDRPLTTELSASDQPLAAALAGGASGGYRDNDQDWYFAARQVPGTPWRLVAAVPAPVLYAPTRDPRVWRGTMVGVVAVAGLLLVFGAARSRRNRWQLRESEQRFREVFEHSLIGMAITAPSRRMLRVNPALCTMLGYTEEQLLQRTLSELTHPDDRDVTAAAITAALAGRTTGFSAEKRYLHADGHAVYTSLTTTLLRDHAGAPLYFATQIIDITERKSFEVVQEATNAQLREAHQRVADLVAMLSHDVRQPLGVITGYTDVVTSDWDTLSDTRRRDFLARISAAARRMTVLVEDILLLTHLDAGTSQPRRAVVDVARVLDGAVGQLADDAGTITVTRAHGPLHAAVDPGHLQQMLLNLLGNATRYGDPPIDVTVTAAGDRVDVTVADHGEGIPAEFVPHLFERFTRASTGVAAAKPGTGLGLYIVEQLAHANRATVSYRPNQPSGARFTLRLAAAAQPASDDARSAGERAEHR